MVSIENFEASGWRCINKLENLGRLGKLILITGENGAGKSTLAHLLYLMATIPAALAQSKSPESLNEKVERILKEQLCLLYDICPPYVGGSERYLDSLFHYNERKAERSKFVEIKLSVTTENSTNPEDITLKFSRSKEGIGEVEMSPTDLEQRSSDLWDYAIAKIGIYPYYQGKHTDDFGLITSEGFIIKKEEELIKLQSDKEYILTKEYRYSNMYVMDPRAATVVPPKAAPLGSFGVALLENVLNTIERLNQGERRYRVKRPFILIEEPERGLNPLTVKDETMELIEKIFSKGKLDTATLVITTQSPFVEATIYKFAKKLTEENNSRDLNLKLEDLTIIEACTPRKEGEPFECKYQKMKYYTDVEDFLPVNKDDEPLPDSVIENESICYPSTLRRSIAEYLRDVL